MVCPVHHELDPRSDLAEFADDQPIAVPVVVMGDVAFELRVRDVGKVADEDVRIPDRGSHIDLPVVSRDRMHRIRVRTAAVFHSAHLSIL